MITKREAAIITAYTNYLIGDFDDFHQYVEKILDRPVYTHELAFMPIVDEIREKSKDDFMRLEVE